MILLSIVSIFQSNWFSPKLLFLCSVHLNTLHIRIFSDPPSESELFCFHLDRLTRDHWRRCLTGSSSGRRGQALESSHQSGVRQDHKWLLQVSVSSVPSLVSLEMVGGIYPFQHFVSAGEDLDWAMPEPPPSDPFGMAASGGTWSCLTELLALCATGNLCS